MVDDLDSPLWALYSTVLGYTNSAGQVMSDPFIRMPNKKFYPDYYEEIENPISLLKIKNKLRVSHTQAYVFHVGLHEPRCLL